MRNKMPAEYYRKRREAKKNGTFVPHKRSETPNAIAHRAAYKETVLAKEAAEEAEIFAEVFRRGRVLAEMMRTPVCMWPAEWTQDLDTDAAKG